MQSPQVRDKIQSKRKELSQKYYHQKKSIIGDLLSVSSYQDTADAAEQSKSFDKNGLTIRNSVFTAVVNLVFIHGIQILMIVVGDKSFHQSAVFYIFETLFTLGSIYGWTTILGRKPKIRIDDQGIGILYSDEMIAWGDVVLTCIWNTVRAGSSSNSIVNYLVVHFYVPYNNDFDERDIDLTNLDTTTSEISAAVEYFRNRAVRD